MNSQEYYTAPSDEIFNDIKRAAIKVWSDYDDTYGYATEKIDRIKDIRNISDNWAYMVAMFDPVNQQKLIIHLERPDSEALVLRLQTEEWSDL